MLNYKSLFLSLFFFTSMTVPSFSKVSLDEIRNILLKSTVQITVQDIKQDFPIPANDPEKYIKKRGTGVVIQKIEEDFYYVLTSAHLLEDTSFFGKKSEIDRAKYMIIVQGSPDLPNGLKYNLRATGWFDYALLDLAVIKLDLRDLYVNGVKVKSVDLPKFKPIKFEDKKYVQKLDVIYSAGFPVMPGNKFRSRNLFITKSEINSQLRGSESEIDIGAYTLVYRLGVKGGMSGGPVINSRGRLVAINGLSEKGLTTEENSYQYFAYAGAWVANFFASKKLEDQIDSGDERAKSVYDYGIDIVDFILMSSFDKTHNSNTKSYFYNYAPKVDRRFMKKIRSEWFKGQRYLPNVGYYDPEKLKKKADKVLEMTDSEVRRKYK